MNTKMLREIIKFVKRLAEKGQLTADVGGVVALLVAIAISAFVLYNITGALETEENSYADNAVKNVEEKGLTVFNLMTITAIAIVAAIIISVVVTAVGGYGPRRPAPAPAYVLKTITGFSGRIASAPAYWLGT